MPRSAPSARIARGSLIQIAWGWSMACDFSARGVKSVPYVTCNSRTNRNLLGSWRRSCKAFVSQLHHVEIIRVSMDLNTITEVAHPHSREQLPLWTAGDAWLAGGTFLFSEPQAHLARLIDLTDLRWPALTVGETSLTIAATCTVAQFDALICPPE